MTITIKRWIDAIRRMDVDGMQKLYYGSSLKGPCDEEHFRWMIKAMAHTLYKCVVQGEELMEVRFLLREERNIRPHVREQYIGWAITARHFDYIMHIDENDNYQTLVTHINILPRIPDFKHGRALKLHKTDEVMAGLRNEDLKTLDEWIRRVKNGRN